MAAYGRAYAERGWGSGQVIDADGRRQTALITGTEIIVMECALAGSDGRPATFTRRVRAM